MNKERYLIVAFRRFREYGEGLIIDDQCISTMDPVIIANLYTVIAGAQRDIQDIRKVVGTMGLPPEPAQLLNKLEPGEVIISLAGRYPHPQLLKIPFVEPKYLTDQDIDQINTQDKILQSLLKRVTPPQKKQERILNARQLTDVKKYLWEVYKFQFLYNKQEITKEAGLPTGTGNRIADYCENNNLIKVLKPRIGQGNPQYPIATQEAHELLGVEEKNYFSKGAGSLHLWGAHQIWKHFSQYRPGFELFRGGKHIDVAIDTAEHLIAFEMEKTSAHIQENIQKDFEKAKVSFLIIVCWDDKVLKHADSIISKMPQNIQNRIQVYTLSDLLKKNPDEFINHITEGR